MRVNRGQEFVVGRCTRRVWIAFSRIQQSARLAKADVSDALGSVIAHEIGHVLMPRGAHALAGLMQHVVDPNLIAQNRVSFLSEEATLIRATLAGDAAASPGQDGAAAVRIPPWPCRLIVRSTLLEVVEDGWHRSETLRRQCRELADAGAIVVLECHTVFESYGRAMTRIGTDSKGIVVAAVSVPPVSHALELVAHEFEPFSKRRGGWTSRPNRDGPAPASGRRSAASKHKAPSTSAVEYQQKSSRVAELDGLPHLLHGGGIRL